MFKDTTIKRKKKRNKNKQKTKQNKQQKTKQNNKNSKNNNSPHLCSVVDGALALAVGAADGAAHVVLHDHISHHTVVLGVGIALHVLGVSRSLGQLELVQVERVVPTAGLALGRYVAGRGEIGMGGR